MRRLAELIVRYFEKHKIISPSPDDREIYVYGFDIAIYTLISTLGLFFVGLLLGYPVESIIMISLFYVNQTLGGGYHASSHLSCFLVMCGGLLVFILLLHFPLSKSLSMILAIVSLVVLFLHPLILHKNKQFLARKSQFFIRRSRAALAIQFFLFVVILFLGSAHYVQAFAIAFTLCAVSRMAAVLSAK